MGLIIYSEEKAEQERTHPEAKTKKEKKDLEVKEEKERNHWEAKAKQETEIQEAEQERKDRESTAEQERKDQEAKAAQEKEDQEKEEAKRVEQQRKEERETWAFRCKIAQGAGIFLIVTGLYICYCTDAFYFGDDDILAADSDDQYHSYAYDVEDPAPSNLASNDTLASVTNVQSPEPDISMTVKDVSSPELGTTTTSISVQNVKELSSPELETTTLVENVNELSSPELDTTTPVQNAEEMLDEGEKI